MSDPEDKIRFSVSLPELTIRALDELRGARSRGAFLSELIETHLGVAEAMSLFDVEEDRPKAREAEA